MLFLAYGLVYTNASVAITVGHLSVADREQGMYGGKRLECILTVNLVIFHVLFSGPT